MHVRHGQFANVRLTAQSLPPELPHKAAEEHVAWQSPNDTEVLSRTCLPSIYTLLKRAQVEWAGNLVRISDTRLPKDWSMVNLIQRGNASQGGQKKRCQDWLKTSLKEFDINTETWQTQVQYTGQSGEAKSAKALSSSNKTG